VSLWLDRREQSEVGARGRGARSGSAPREARSLLRHPTIPTARDSALGPRRAVDTVAFSYGRITSTRKEEFIKGNIPLKEVEFQLRFLSLFYLSSPS